MGLAKVRVIPLAPVPPPMSASKATVTPLVGTATGDTAEPDWKVDADEVRSRSAPDRTASPFNEYDGMVPTEEWNTLTFLTTKLSVRPPVAAVNTSLGLGGDIGHVRRQDLHAGHPHGEVRAVDRHHHVGGGVLQGGDGGVGGHPVGNAGHRSPVGDTHEIAEGSAPCLKLDRPTATPLIPE